MNISSVAGYANGLWGQINASSATHSSASVSNVNPNSDGAQDGLETVKRAGHHHHHGDSAFMQSVMQALSSMGVTPGAGSTTAAGQSTDSDGDNDRAASGVSGTQSPQQAMHAFMHDLFQTLRQDGQTAGNSSTATTSASPVSGYAKMETGIQNLITELNSSTNTSSGSANSNLSSLQSDFQNLMATLGHNGDTTAGTTNGAPSLATFLQNLEGNLQKNDPLLQSKSVGIQATA
jgi:hypothetical protein